MSIRIRKRKLPSGNIQLFLDIYVNRKRQREALGLFLTSDRNRNSEVLQLAEAIRAKRELQVHSGEYDIDYRGRCSLPVIPFAETIYLNKPPRTQQPYRSAFDHLIAFAGKDVAFSHLTTQFCEGFRNYLLTKLKPATAGAYFARFKTIIHGAIRERIITHDPALGIFISKPDSLPKYLTLEEVIKLRDTPCGNQAVKDAFLFSCFTGLRYEDVNTLTWDMVRGNAIEFTQSKTKSSERLPLSKDAILILEKQRNAVKNINVQRIHPPNMIFKLPARQTMDKVLKTWAHHAKLGRVLSFHKARHTFATLALSSGVDIYTTSKLLGHKSIVTTSIYAKVVDSKKTEAINKLPRIYI